MNKSMPQQKIVLRDRLFARSKGCWNCSSAGDPVTVGLVFWKTHARPRDELVLIRPHKDAVAAIPAGDKRMATKAKRAKLLTAIEENTRRLDGVEASIKNGELIRCTNRRCKDIGDFKSHRFLCDQWSGAAGASLAAGGGATSDMLPDEMKDVFGDGN